MCAINYFTARYVFREFFISPTPCPIHSGPKARGSTKGFTYPSLGTAVLRVQNSGVKDFMRVQF